MEKTGLFIICVIYHQVKIEMTFGMYYLINWQKRLQNFGVVCF